MGSYPAVVEYWPAPLQPAPRPRVWPALVLPFLAVAAAVAGSVVVLLVAAIANLGPQGMSDAKRTTEWLHAYGATPVGFVVLIVPSQGAFLGAALVAAWCSPVPVRRRLGLVRPSVPWWGLLLLVAATPAVAAAGGLLSGALFETPGENLEMIQDLLGGQTGLTLVVLTGCISLLPGFGEEMLFRGFTQSRLLRRWHPAAAIGVSSVLFAAAHFEPAHVVAVLPLGVWLGVMAWLCGSIWPAILCHVTNNATAALTTHLDPEAQAGPVNVGAIELTAIGVSAVCLALALWVMHRHRQPAPPDAPGTPLAG